MVNFSEEEGFRPTKHVKFVGENGFYPKWAQGEGRWVHQKVLVVTGSMPSFTPPETSRWLVWVPPKGDRLGLRKTSPQVEASRASGELNQIRFQCFGCGWRGMGSNLSCFGDPVYWVLECPECFTPLAPDLRGLDTDAIIRQWHRLGRPALESPGAAWNIVSVKPIDDLPHWINSFEPMENELAYVGQQLWPNFLSFIRDAQSLELYNRRNEQTFREGVKGVIYFGAEDEKLYALDASTGKFKWSYKAGGRIYSSPAVANGIVYFGSWDKRLYALDASTGNLKWSYETADCITSSPAVVNGMVYFGSWDKNLYELDASTGSMKWFYRTGDRVMSSPTVANEAVYFGSEDGNWYAIDAKNSSVKWSFKREIAIDDEEFGYGCLGVADGFIYFLSSDEKLNALDAETGKPRWTYYDPERYEEDSLGGIEHVAIGESGIIFCSGTFIGIRALDGKTGEVLWSYKNPHDLDDLKPDIGGPLAVANGMVYVGGNELFIALDAETGAIVWRYDNEEIDLISNEPSVMDRIVCFCVNSKLFALDAITGDYRWSYEADGEISSSPAIGPTT